MSSPNTPTETPPPSVEPRREEYPLTFFGGTVFGFVLGSALAIWYAPRSGTETKQALQAWFRKAGRYLQGESIEEALNTGRTLAHRHRARQAQPLVNNGQQHPLQNSNQTTP